MFTIPTNEGYYYYAEEPINTNLVLGKCYSNLDLFKNKSEEWPEIFYSIPQKNDFIKSSTGTILKVVGITHTIIKTSNGEKFPFIEIELHKIV